MVTLSHRNARRYVTPRLALGVRRASKLVLSLAGVVALSACADEEPPPAAEKNPFELNQPESTPTRRVAQVKIALSQVSDQLPQGHHAPAPTQNAEELPAAAGPVEPEPLLAPAVDVAQQIAPASGPLSLKVRGDFAAFRGVQERLVWAFAGVSEPVWSSLQVGDCIGVDGSAPRASELNAAEAQGAREIELLDLGRFEIELGEQRFEVPLHLAPGVLPYASGVQYRGEQELLLPGRAQKDLGLGWQGLAELPGSRLSAPVPPKLNFELSPSDADQGEEESTWYDMAWSPAKGDAASRLYLHARLAPSQNEAADAATKQQSEQVVCRLADRGEWQLDLEELADEGLDISSEDSDIEFELRRVQEYSQSAPGFERVQVQIERSESLRLRPDAG